MKLEKILNIALFFIFTLLAFAIAQDEQKSTDDEKAPFTFISDWNRFRAADSLTYFEFMASINRSLLTYKQQDNKYVAEFIVEASISNNDSVVAIKKWRNINEADSLEAINPNQILYAMNNFILPPDEYTLELKITDLFGQDRLEIHKLPFKTGIYDGDVKISDIQLASSIEADKSGGPYTKNGFKVMPNPSSLYGIGLPILYAYTEIYNLSESSSEEGNKYTVTYQILDDNDQEVKSFPEKQRKKPGASAVEVNNLNVVTCVSGTYTLQVTVKDEETGKTASTRRKFFVYREGDYAEGGAKHQKVEMAVGVGSPGLDASRYESMTEEELDVEFEMAQYIAEREERRTWKKLELQGKRGFLKEFWAKRDETPDSPINEFKQDYLSRSQLANIAYQGTFREGWKTDRGRVLILFGKPDEIERFPMSNENKEYEIWNYYAIQGGIYFIFADKRGLSDLELVHSTARGELYDPDWQRWVLPNN